jgi:hypothetical protein
MQTSGTPQPPNVAKYKVSGTYNPQAQVLGTYGLAALRDPREGRHRGRYRSRMPGLRR